MPSFPPLNLAEHLEQGTLTFDVLTPYARMIKEQHPDTRQFFQSIQRLTFEQYRSYLALFKKFRPRKKDLENYDLYHLLRNTLLEACPLDFSCYQLLTSQTYFPKVLSLSKSFYEHNRAAGVIFILQHHELIDKIFTAPKETTLKETPVFLSEILLNFSKRHFFKKADFDTIDRLSADYFQHHVVATPYYTNELLLHAATNGYEQLSQKIIQKIPQLAENLNSDASFDDLLPSIYTHLSRSSCMISLLGMAEVPYQHSQLREVSLRRYEEFYLKCFELYFSKLDDQTPKVRIREASTLLLVALSHKMPRLIEMVMQKMTTFTEQEQNKILSSRNFLKNPALSYQIATHRAFKDFWKVLFAQDASNNFKNKESINRILACFFKDIGIPAKLLNAALQHDAAIIPLLKSHLRKNNSTRSLCVSFPTAQSLGYSSGVKMATYLEFTKFPELFSAAALNFLRANFNINMLAYLLEIGGQNNTDRLEYHYTGTAGSDNNYKVFYMNFAVLADLFLSPAEIAWVHHKVKTGSPEIKHHLFVRNYQKGLWNWGIHHLLMYKNPAFFLAREAIADTLGEEQALNFIWDIDKYPVLQRVHYKYENIAHRIEQIHIDMIQSRQPLILSGPAIAPRGIEKAPVGSRAL